MKEIKDNFLINYIDQGFENMNPRNELPKVYIRSGAIYAILTKNFYEEQSLVSNLCSPIILDKIETPHTNDILNNWFIIRSEINFQNKELIKFNKHILIDKKVITTNYYESLGLKYRNDS